MPRGVPVGWRTSFSHSITNRKNTPDVASFLLVGESQRRASHDKSKPYAYAATKSRASSLYVRADLPVMFFTSSVKKSA